jgi:hypothetical protein
VHETAGVRRQRRIKEWVGSYTELRDYQKELASRPAKKVEAPVEAAPAKKKPAGKMTFAEQNELKKIDKDLPALEKKKEELAAEMVAKSADHHAIMQLSIDLEKVTSQLDTLGGTVAGFDGEGGGGIGSVPIDFLGVPRLKCSRVGLSATSPHSSFLLACGLSAAIPHACSDLLDKPSR